MNPLYKRLPRELKSDIGKYFILFVFITIMIGFVSGFLVASESMIVAYKESFEKYQIEDGNFELVTRMDETLKSNLEKEEVTIFQNYYIEQDTDVNNSALRIFINREKVNLVCLMDGKLPDSEDAIAIDRMYADNNHISINETITVGGQKLTVCGLVALSDYSALFQSPSDMMFDSIKFGVAVMTKEGFENLGDNGIHYSYSWKYDKAPKDDIEAKKMSEDFLKTLAENNVVKNYIPQYSNQAIHFAGDDLGLDKVSMAVFLYIVITIISFIFAITTGNTIVKESMVIGTLRASGYTKSELVRHYLTMPMFVTFISAIIGNILGYTCFKNIAIDMYYGSFSLPTYVTLWNTSAFIQTTVVPMILMFVINLIILVNKLNLSPLKFIRRELSQKKNRINLNLSTKISIVKRFWIRILIQNIPNYITIFIGIFLANVVLLLGVALPHLLDKNQQDIVSNMICQYQYILKSPVESDVEGIEKYSVTSLKTIDEKLKSEEVAVLGIITNSDYIDILPKEDEVYISNAYAEKFQINEGETVTLKEAYGNKAYCFKVKGIYYYPSNIAVFMNQEYFNKIFEKDADYFNGYFSENEIDDIDKNYVATVITEDDMIKCCRQLQLSMGEIMDLFFTFGIVMFMLIIYLLSKIVIEKNAQSISMTKILGYSNREIGNLYIMSTSIVVVFSMLITLPLVNMLMKIIIVKMFSVYSGWIPYYVPIIAFVEIAAAGILAYAVIAFIQYRRVKKIPLDMALKNVE